MVEDMLRECGYEPKDIAVIAVSSGPGSFTGIRIGCASAKGLAWAAGAKIIPVSSLEAIAYSSCIRENAVLSAEIDARNGFVYNALFDAEQCSEPLRRLTPDRVIARSELAQNPEPIVTVTNVTAKGVILASIGKAFGEAEPIYLRLSQAERMRGKE
jgi:tRNA threonylcarbamoyladenosine biosynthesis protein TsaB